jgi:predicted nucleic acid-binding Zn ribbon protein
MFQNGCPMCGYSAPPPQKAGNKPHGKKPRRAAEPMPAWTLILSVIALFVVVWLFSYLITR